MNNDAPKISILLPSRGRPTEFERMWKSALETADAPDSIEFVVYMDKDDTSEYLMPKNSQHNVGPRVVLSEMWNECYKLAKADIFMHAGDDLIFRTKGWDSMVVQTFHKFPDRILFVHGDDGYWGSTFGTHGFLHRKWVEVLGYFVPPLYVSDFNDTHLNELANMVGRRVYMPFVTEHMHFLFGKGAKDQTHIDRLIRHEQEKPEELYQSKQAERQADGRKLFDFINNFNK